MIDSNFVLQLIQIIAWPLLVFFIFWLFRQQLRELLKRIKGISYKNLNLQSPTQDENHGVRDELLKKKNASGRLIFDKLIDICSDETIANVKTSITEVTQIDLTADLGKRETVILRYTMALFIILKFQRVYDLIYGSQIRILQKVNSSNIETKTSLKGYYDKAKEYYPPNYEHYLYDDYLKFLNTYGLILIEDEKILISSYGRDFLKYIAETGLSFEKPY